MPRKITDTDLGDLAYALDLVLEAYHLREQGEEVLREAALSEARALCCRLLDRHPHWAEPAETKATILIELGYLAEARSELHKLLYSLSSSTARDAAVARAKAHNLLGQVGIESDSQAEALYHYLEAAREAAANTPLEATVLDEAHDGVVSCLHGLGRAAEARKHLQHAQDEMKRLEISEHPLIDGQAKMLAKQLAEV